MTESSSSIVWRGRKHVAECGADFETIAAHHQSEGIVEIAIYQCTTGQELPHLCIKFNDIQETLDGCGVIQENWMKYVCDQIVLRPGSEIGSYTVGVPWKRCSSPLAHGVMFASDASLMSTATKSVGSSTSLALIPPQDCPQEELAPEPEAPLHARQQHRSRGFESPGTHVHASREEQTTVDVEDTRHIEVLHLGSKIFAAGTVQVLVAMHKRSRMFEMIVIAPENRAELGRFYVRYDGLLSVVDQQIIQDRLRFATANSPASQDGSVSIGSLLRDTTLAVMAEHLLESLVVLREASGAVVAQIQSEELTARSLVATTQPSNIPKLQWLLHTLPLDTIEELPESNKTTPAAKDRSHTPAHKKQKSASAQLWERCAYDDAMTEDRPKPPRSPGFMTALLIYVLGWRDSRVLPSGEATEGEEEPSGGMFQPLYNAVRSLSHKRRPLEERKATGNGPFKKNPSISTMSLATASSNDTASVHSRSTSRRVPLLALSGLSSP